MQGAPTIQRGMVFDNFRVIRQTIDILNPHLNTRGPKWWLQCRSCRNLIQVNGQVLLNRKSALRCNICGPGFGPLEG